VVGKKGKETEPERIQEKRKTFKMALDSGVRICMGGDVGVFPHGDNARELEMMVEYGMKPVDVLRSSTSINAESFKIRDLGKIKKGFLADILIVEGNPAEQISDIRKVKFVIKDGCFVK
jgi:imidazolonepropionase-like amidohydrolase